MSVCARVSEFARKRKKIKKSCLPRPNIHKYAYGTYERVMTHIWMSHGTHMNESWHTYVWVMAHISMSHGTHMNESWHTYEWKLERRGPWLTCTWDIIHVPHRHNMLLWRLMYISHELHVCLIFMTYHACIFLIYMSPIDIISWHTDSYTRFICIVCVPYIHDISCMHIPHVHVPHRHNKLL